MKRYIKICTVEFERMESFEKDIPVDQYWIVDLYKVKTTTSTFWRDIILRREKLCLCNMVGEVLEVFKFLKLNDHMTHYDTLAEALYANKYGDYDQANPHSTKVIKKRKVRSSSYYRR